MPRTSLKCGDKYLCLVSIAWGSTLYCLLCSLWPGDAFHQLSALRSFLNETMLAQVFHILFKIGWWRHSIGMSRIDSVDHEMDRSKKTSLEPASEPTVVRPPVHICTEGHVDRVSRHLWELYEKALSVSLSLTGHAWQQYRQENSSQNQTLNWVV